MYAIGGLGVLALGLIAFAICKRDSVKASLKFWKIDFSLEAKNENSRQRKRSA